MGKLNFISTEPTLDEYWRSIVLFGANVASYKFALAKSLLEIAPTGKTFVTLEELSQPFARHLCEHLKLQDKQTTSTSSRFLDACRDFNVGRMSEGELIAIATKRGFENVIDAFHVVNQTELPQRFFTDERKSDRRGIVITDELFKLFESEGFGNLEPEVEARWRLVETAWGEGISRNLLQVQVDESEQMLFIVSEGVRRIDITSSRNALDGYQKGKCFYCFGAISIEPGAENLTDVDHVFPHKLHDLIKPIDGVWNLVLACQECNRGVGGKFDRLPSQQLVQRLHNRNEFLIGSHHPLRETLMLQTGKDEPRRSRFLIGSYEAARPRLGYGEWEPELLRGVPSF